MEGMSTMVNVYIEPRPKGRAEGSAIDEYAIETVHGEELATKQTQEEAIRWAKSLGYHPLVARVHNTSRGNPNHWRSAD